MAKIKSNHTHAGKKAKIKIYTMGYQYFSIDNFINVLAEKGIKVVIDIRNTPFSYKQGFTKNCLARYLYEVGIEYYSFRDLGVEKAYRTKHFSSYYLSKLKTKKEKIKEVADIIKSNPSALMCFEASPQECHRNILAQKIREVTSLEISHYISTSKQWREEK